MLYGFYDRTALHRRPVKNVVGPPETMTETTDAGSEARTNTDAPHAEKIAHLSAFQRDLLHALAHLGPSKGLAVKRGVGEYYGEEVNHGRLYPNLDELVEEGLISKSERDKRTNEYALTEAGRRALSARQAWTEGSA